MPQIIEKLPLDMGRYLNLLYSILVNNGVDYNKINIIFTDREPNSFIIRNVRYASEEDAINAHKKAYNPWY